MGSLFSKKKEPEKPKITEQDKAILVGILLTKANLITF